MTKRALALMAIASLAIATRVFAEDQFTPEEQDLSKAGAVMELYDPAHPHRHSIETITANGKSGKVVVITFGSEDAAPARAEGSDMKQMHYSSHMAEMFLYLEGWEKYKPDRFFTRAYVQEGMEAFNHNR